MELPELNLGGGFGIAYLPDDDPDAVNSQQDFDPIDRFLAAG
mgnify:CR=1 FL=1